MDDKRDELINPMDAVDYRWLVVKSLCETGRKPGNHHDKFIWRAWRFYHRYIAIRAAKTADEFLERCDLAKEHKIASAAVSMYLEPGMRNQYIEALSTCDDLTLDEQAEYLGVLPDVVLMYEKLFYDVRDKKHNKGFMSTRVISPAIIREIHDAKNPMYCWKLVAVFGGSSAVRALWEFARQDEGVAAFYRDAGLGQMFKNFSIAQYFRPVDASTAAEITDHVMKMLEVEVKRAALGEQEVVATRATVVEELLTACKFLVRDPDEQNLSQREPRLRELSAKVLSR